ncbi:uncharacterized protein LOC117888296 isoform X3 [Trachemys scripta elegans]|uniref:uncharacterized protein LOC117888296 isoform X3 n=1 Tax=Trachemys scripta elegans TaxID=31138 RepID=UPI0015528A10|nr:uncharacterized protein LOC117888296 isoform X3 [Trachemys scripta elegans]
MLCGQQRPQEPSPDSQQEASPCPVTEDLPASPGQEVEDPCPTTSSSARSPWDSSSAWDSGSSEADGRRCFVLGTARDSGDEEEEWVDVATEEAALNNSREQLQGGEKELIEELPDNSPPGAVLANSLIAVGNLRICLGSCQTSWTPCWGTCWQSPQTPTGSSTSWRTQRNSPGWVTTWHSWLCSSVTQTRTSAGRPGRGFTGSTSCCCTRGVRNPAGK